MPPALLRCLPLALLAAAAFWLRTDDLASRPMHADEANQGVKTGELVEAGRYAFDPRDHHGPTLYYLGAAVAAIRGQATLAALDETTLRLVPAFAGALAVPLVVLLGRRRAPEAPGLSGPAALAAGAFLALAPPAVYYSRYFIQETLLATGALAVAVILRRWSFTGRMRWAIAAGAGLGLMQATKASTPLFIAAAGIAWLFSRGAAHPASPRPGRDLLAGIGAAAGTAALLYSSFGTHWAGLRDALAVYLHAVIRFGAEAPPTGHEKAWTYYLQLLGWSRTGGLLWHQAGLSILALAGLAAVARRRDPLLRGVALYGLLILAAFSAFPYKTPWHAIHFVVPAALLAGAALDALGRGRAGPAPALAATLLVGFTLWQQTRLTSFLRPADGRNPWAYVHSSRDVLKFRPLAEAARAVRPGQPIRVVSEEYWPLPWYFRGLPNVGYWSEAPADCSGALVIASVTQAETVRARLGRPARESYVGLRPGFLCVVFQPEP
ncbi:MAG: flippase activity-associated protein Agl23 [Opitutaceae bacterium]